MNAGWNVHLTRLKRSGPHPQEVVNRSTGRCAVEFVFLGS